MYRLERISIKNISTCIFVSSFFFVEISLDGQPLVGIPLYKAELFILLLFAFIKYHIKHPKVEQTRRLFFTLGSLAVIQLAYLLGSNTYPIAGSLGNYAWGSLRVYGYIVSVLTYSFILYEESKLLSIFYSLGKVCLGVGLFAFLVYDLSGVPLLVDTSYGGLRAQAFFTEPSAAAPAVAVVGIMAWKKRDWVGLFISVGFAVSTSSATVLLVSIFSIPSIYLARRGPLYIWSGLLSAAISLSLFFANGGISWLKNAPYFGQTVNRLARGIEFMVTLSQKGYNPRFLGAMNVYEHLKNEGILWFGYGLNSANTYFRHVHVGTDTSVQTYSLLLNVLFSFGIIGLLVFVCFSYISVVKMSKRKSNIVYLFIPFLICSMINSAQGFITYKFVIMGIAISFRRTELFISGEKEGG